ncbi:MAG: RagB/SusD family nutrient uptake outer membrane protein [Bacteroidales bacterium]|nr:RagB/SusD family nutrient uptake outer membrane protein [Bacteroidales bacterium]
MKKTLYTLLAVVISLVAVSCNEFLKETPKGQLTDNLAFTEPGDLESALGVLRYKVTRSAFGTTQFEHAYMGDDLATHPKSNKAAMREWDSFEISTSNERLLWHWQDKWLVIRAANFIIGGAENAPNSADEIAKAINTAKFWRAWAYFDLVRTYGALPLITDLNVDYGMGLSSIAVIYDQIVADLKDACNLPKENHSGLIPYVAGNINNDPNSGAAHALLACVYLNMAGWPLQKGAEYYNLCKQECEAVINGGYYYELYKDYRDIHSAKENFKNKEAIVNIYFSKDTGEGDSSLMCRGGIMDFPDCSDAWCDCRGELKFWKDFPDGYRKTVVYPKTCVRNVAIVDFWDDQVPVDNRFPYFGEKGWRSESNDPNNPVEYDFNDLSGFSQSGGWDIQAHMVIRLSEVYCWYAECCARAGDTATAIKYLNLVRNRAEGVDIGYPGAKKDFYTGKSKEQLIEGAYNEHRYEIGGWWSGAIQSCADDLIRLKRAEAHFNYRKNPTPINCGGKSLIEPYGPVGTWNDCQMFAHYPAEEQELNPNMAIPLEKKTTDEFINGTEVIYATETEK